MTTTQIILTIRAAAAATVLTRALPFFAFPADRPAPRYIRYLGNALPGDRYPLQFTQTSCQLRLAYALGSGT